jgi:hypothetical protein
MKLSSAQADGRTLGEYSEGDRIRGEWHGKLAEEWCGDVQEEYFARLANGQHPIMREQLVLH